MDIKVVLDKLTPYAPGDTVTGKVLFVKSSNSPTLAKAIGLKIQFVGKTTVKFTVADNFNYKGRWKTHSNSETYFNSTKYLVGNGLSEVPELAETGIREYPFSYILPPSIPSSYRGTHGSVDYVIVVTLKRAWGVNKEHTHIFQVNAELDIGSHHNSRQLTTIRKSEKVGMLWWSGTVYVNFNLKKKSYVCGECVQFSAQIINDSKSKIHKAKLLFTQECRFYAQGGSHTVTHILKKVKGPGVRSGENTVLWENNNLLKIPPLPPTNLGGFCRFIEINYFVHLLVQPSSIALKDKTIVCKLPVTLGTKRGPGNRASYPNSCTGSLMLGNRVGNIFGGSNSLVTSPRGTLDSRFTSPVPSEFSTMGQMSYYQNVVFPLTRCFSAPLYENLQRFPPRAPMLSPLPFNQGFITEEQENEEQKYEPPPTYDEAMRHSRMSNHTEDEDEGSSESEPSQPSAPPLPGRLQPPQDIYQNSIMSPSRTPTISPIRSLQQLSSSSGSPVTISEQPSYANNSR